MAKVLVVDRDPYMSQLLMAHLSMQGFEVLLANKGQDGFTMALQERPDMIIMNDVLPDSTGFQLCNRLRREPSTQAIPILLLSALAEFANQKQYAFERGVNEFMSKPVKIIELGEIVDRYIGPKPQTAGAEANGKPEYAASTDVHAALSEWLSKALTRERNGAPSSKTQKPE